MSKTTRGALKGAAVGLAVSIAAVSFVAGPESIWDWPAHSRGLAVVFGFAACVVAACFGVALSEESK